MDDAVSKKATWLLRLSILFQERPRAEQVRELLDRAQRAGVKPAGLYLSAMKLHPRDLPLPLDPRAVLEVPAWLRRHHGAPDTPDGHPERGLVCARVLVVRARECSCRGRGRPHRHRG